VLVISIILFFSNPFLENVIKVGHVAKCLLSNTQSQTSLCRIYIAFLTPDHSLGTVLPHDNGHRVIAINILDFGNINFTGFNRLFVEFLGVDIADVLGEGFGRSNEILEVILPSLVDQFLLAEDSISLLEQIGSPLDRVHVDDLDVNLVGVDIEIVGFGRDVAGDLLAVEFLALVGYYGLCVVVAWCEEKYVLNSVVHFSLLFRFSVGGLGFSLLQFFDSAVDNIIEGFPNLWRRFICKMGVTTIYGTACRSSQFVGVHIAIPFNMVVYGDVIIYPLEHYIT
jgi:hypothetical protein